MRFISKSERKAMISGQIRRVISQGGDQILEAGCGRLWPFDFEDLKFTLTGIDLDEIALKDRQQADLDIAIVGDLRTVELDPDSFDIIYNAFVLEHVAGAAKVLDNFARWLKPGGLAIIMFPNRDSVYGFFTRITPHWLHVAYKRYIKGKKMAGRRGYPPYPTYYDKVLSRRLFLDFASRNKLMVKEEAYFGKEPAAIEFFMRIVEILTFGRLSAKAQSLLYVLEKSRS